MVIKRILCPVDLSLISERAFVHATAFARWHDAELTTLLVSPTRDAARPERLAAFVSTAAELSKAIRQVVTTGPVVTEILRVAAEMPADLIVMGTHGTSGFRRLVLGSVTEQVLRSSPCAVVTVPAGANRRTVEPVAFRTIVCAIDFSDSSTRALEYAVSVARKVGGRLVLAHVLEWFAEESEEPVVGSATTTFPTAEEDARSQLEALLTSDARACQPDVIVHY
jgi:nucleotide-binding universal stress UspA family protein